jgi:preprotein translocase subunit SecG
MLFGILTVLFVIVSLLLGLLILVQSDKGGGISGAIGGGMGGANSVIGAQNTENILTRGTTILAATYFILTIALFLVAAKINKTSGGVSQLKERATNSASGFVPANGAAALPIESENQTATPAVLPVASEEADAPATAE